MLDVLTSPPYISSCFISSCISFFAYMKFYCILLVIEAALDLADTRFDFTATRCLRLGNISIPKMLSAFFEMVS